MVERQAPASANTASQVGRKILQGAGIFLTTSHEAQLPQRSCLGVFNVNSCRNIAVQEKQTLRKPDPYPLEDEASYRDFLLVSADT